MNNTHIFLVVIITSLLIFSGCINKETGENGEKTQSKEKNFFDLKISISNVNASNFTVYTPIIVDPSTGNPIQVVVDELRNERGVARFEIIETRYGKALNITGHNDVVIRAYKEDTGFIYYPFSMQKGGVLKKKGKIEYWVYYRNEYNMSASLSIGFTSTHDYGGYISNMSGNIKNGWNIIIGTATAGGA